MHTTSVTSYLQLLMDLIGQLLAVLPQQLDRLLQRLEHLVGRRLALLHRHQVTHALHQAVVVTFLHLLVQPRVSDLDELGKVVQAVGHVIDEMLLEHEAPALDNVKQRLLERLGVDAEPRVEQVQTDERRNFVVNLLVRIDLKRGRI